jgi:hypothetical protein
VSKNDSLANVRYHARQVVTHKTAQGDLEAVLTSKGRPMTRECPCKSVHQLAAAVAGNFEEASLQYAKNMLEFQHTRSSDAFRRTALAMQQLPRSDTHCFDLVEEAITAMVKGHMPRARKAVVINTQSDRESDWPDRTRRDDEHVLPFGQLWRDYRVDAVPKTMSTLNMFDFDLERQDKKELEEKAAMKKAAPTDWVSYVDELYTREESA